MFSHKKIASLLKIPSNTFSLDKVKGDASDRQYYRVRYDVNRKSVIIMLLPSPVAPPLPYIEVQQLLKRSGIDVPEIYHYEKKEGLLIIEDCGDISLEQLLLATNNQAEKEDIYKKGIDIIIDMQAGVIDEGKGEEAFKLTFDKKKLMWELNFMLKHLVEDLFHKNISKTELREILGILGNLCGELANEPRVFTHRDYHSRNILVKNGEMFLIDFQDARMGPCQYDLVSLLKDSYSPIDNLMLKRLVDYYLEKRGEIKRENFIRLFDLMTLQRSLKAAGTFAFQMTVKQKNSYLKYLPTVLGYSIEVIGKYRELEGLKTIFDGCIEKAQNIATLPSMV